MYPLFATPVVLLLSLIFSVYTMSPTLTLWGSSHRTVTVSLTSLHVAIKLYFLLKLVSLVVIVVAFISAVLAKPVEPVFWRMNPSTGFLEFSASLGIT